MYDVVLAKLVLDAFELQTKLLMHTNSEIPAREIMDLQICGHEKVIVHWYYPDDYENVQEVVFLYNGSTRQLKMEQGCLFQDFNDAYSIAAIIEFYKRNRIEVSMPEAFKILATA